MITEAFCSVVSWSARNERSSREESSNFESYQFQQQIEQQRSMQQHMQWMQQQETLRRQSQERQGREQESQERRGREQESRVTQQRREQERQESVHQEARSQEVNKTQERSTSRKGARTVIDILKHNKEEKQEKGAASSAASLKKASLVGKEAAEVTQIPVKNYRSRTLSRSGRRREPSPPVDYPSGAGAEYSDDTDETNDVRIAEYEAGHGGRGRSMRRKASTQSFSKKTSVTRNYPGCVIA